MATLIDGKLISAKVKEEIAGEVITVREEYGRVPGLAVIIVGEDPASQVYVRNKEKACETVGFYSVKLALPAETTEEELLQKIDELNEDPTIDGILVQLPLPRHISEEKVILRIRPDKDVDAFHPQNVGKIMIGNFDFLPCTPAGVMELLDRYGIDVAGKHCVVVGRSNIVGKPQSMLLLHKNATVTVCHSKTRDLPSVTRGADVLVVAVGRPNFVTADMVKEGCAVIDVGINRMADGKLCGDVAFAEVEKVASAITPVPGGVGPMTIAMLMKNTLTAARLHEKK